MSSAAPFRVVVVPVDPGHGTHRAIPPAVALARMAGAEVKLVCVASGEGGTREDAMRAITAVEASVAGVPVTGEVVTNESPAAGIVAAAVSLPGSVICMASSGPGRIVENFRHTISPDVVRAAPCPVVLVGPQCTDIDPVYTEVLACLDGSPASDAVISTASAWCAGLGLSAWAIEVVEPSTGGTSSPGAEMGYVQRRARDIGRSGVEVNWDTLHGKDPAGAIVKYVSDRKHSLVMMGSHGHTRRDHLRMGSVVLHTTHHAPFPVVVVPPAAAPLPSV